MLSTNQSIKNVFHCIFIYFIHFSYIFTLIQFIFFLKLSLCSLVLSLFPHWSLHIMYSFISIVLGRSCLLVLNSRVLKTVRHQCLYLPCHFIPYLLVVQPQCLRFYHSQTLTQDVCCVTIRQVSNFTGLHPGASAVSHLNLQSTLQNLQNSGLMLFLKEFFLSFLHQVYIFLLV